MTLSKPIVFMLVSTFSLSLNGVFSKLLTESLSVQLLSMLRFFVPAFILFAFMALTQFHLPHRKMWRALWVRSICMAGCQLCFLWSMQTLTLVESVVLFSTGPLFIPVLERLIFKVKISAMNIVCLVIMAAGVLLLAGDLSEFSFKWELLVGLAAGALVAGSQLALFRASKGSMTPASLNAWTFLLAFLFLVPVYLVIGPSHTDTALLAMPEEQEFVWIMLLVLSLLIVNTQVFRAKAYQLVETGSQLAPLIYTNLVFTCIWQFTLFSESLDGHKIMGISLIVLASMMNTLKKGVVRIHKALKPAIEGMRAGFVIYKETR
ncbi:putative Permease of the drug/metabolite transporter (DMT) superfamily [Vibrio nigripulchritudo SFn27]|uniref:Putative Permease of the drug/metabolite transporter (DMT) superfamily n=1 Tax=Vibrio nigripulchritudo TaxID=28173 RepID=U4KIP6_9VIBR|nr:DMT family transporter [Vibrio nigripulchritudo]CCN80954.1 putative Permease of the drug/metabolite transporter (DMT) superfamily [Vibrio nigripulchritudo BLFn1]CCN89175.1 putative Permease of the drug/metabolite transporter (DMT) superfamily [Vibrio nigripulchritudo SFn27]CCN96632.1 putative Permease of the drug/metabolite transporter (DMT) superfamily [Vibrio nigripulchritudo ENn2]CCO39598.1 putative Permease of the drug/metabolite transporter (DMT) superfamily [Vibrio nigripulchritudo SFn